MSKSKEEILSLKEQLKSAYAKEFGELEINVIHYALYDLLSEKKRQFIQNWIGRLDALSLKSLLEELVPKKEVVVTPKVGKRGRPKKIS